MNETSREEKRMLEAKESSKKEGLVQRIVDDKPSRPRNNDKVVAQ